MRRLPTGKPAELPAGKIDERIAMPDGQDTQQGALAQRPMAQAQGTMAPLGAPATAKYRYLPTGGARSIQAVSVGAGRPSNRLALRMQLFDLAQTSKRKSKSAPA